MMEIANIGKIHGGQDGAVWGKYLFRFSEWGDGFVYDLDTVSTGVIGEIATFKLGAGKFPVPHSNAVFFGTEYYDETDEFPLLYSNIYNNYAGASDPLKGVACVYRLQKDKETFRATPVQLIGIGFTEDASLWKVSETEDGARPYGNFVIDREKNRYYAFVMRNEQLGTRYFAFDLPKLSDGVFDEKYGVRRVTLEKEDIVERFDCEFHRFVQGACAYDGKIYSLEGFANDADRKPAIRVIDLAEKRETFYASFMDVGLTNEPELIDFRDGVCYYGDGVGNLYTLAF